MGKGTGKPIKPQPYRKPARVQGWIAKLAQTGGPDQRRARKNCCRIAAQGSAKTPEVVVIR